MKNTFRRQNSVADAFATSSISGSRTTPTYAFLWSINGVNMALCTNWAAAIPRHPACRTPFFPIPKVLEFELACSNIAESWNLQLCRHSGSNFCFHISDLSSGWMCLRGCCWLLYELRIIQFVFRLFRSQISRASEGERLGVDPRESVEAEARRDRAEHTKVRSYIALGRGCMPAMSWYFGVSNHEHISASSHPNPGDGVRRQLHHPVHRSQNAQTWTGHLGSDQRRSSR